MRHDRGRGVLDAEESGTSIHEFRHWADATNIWAVGRPATRSVTRVGIGFKEAVESSGSYSPFWVWCYLIWACLVGTRLQVLILVADMPSLHHNMFTAKMLGTAYRWASM